MSSRAGNSATSSLVVHTDSGIYQLSPKLCKPLEQLLNRETLTQREIWRRTILEIHPNQYGSLRTSAIQRALLTSPLYHIQQSLDQSHSEGQIIPKQLHLFITFNRHVKVNAEAPRGGGRRLTINNSQSLLKLHEEDVGQLKTICSHCRSSTTRM